MNESVQVHFYRKGHFSYEIINIFNKNFNSNVQELTICAGFKYL